MRIFLSSMVLVALLCQVQGFSLPWGIKFGRCPKIHVEQDFNISNYMGKWYAQREYNVELMQGKGKCVQAHYVLDDTQNIVDVSNQQISLPSDKWKTINGTAKPKDASKDEGSFEVTLKVWPWYSVTGPYDVLGTDYKTYTVVYGCKNFFFIFHSYSAWIMSRVENLSKKQERMFNNKTNAVLRANDIDPATFTKVDQKNC